MNIYSERTRFTILQNVFTLKCCQATYEKFHFKKNGTGNVREREGYKIERITVVTFSDITFKI